MKAQDFTTVVICSQQTKSISLVAFPLNNYVVRNIKHFDLRYYVVSKL